MKRIVFSIAAIMIVSMLLSSFAIVRFGVAQPQPNVDAIAVWPHYTGGPLGFDIYYSVYDLSANAWWSLTPAVTAPIANLVGQDDAPAISFDRYGRAIVVWEHDTTNPLLGWDIYYSIWLGPAVGWTVPAPIAQIPYDDADPAIALWWDGTGTAVWIHYNATPPAALGEIWYSQWNGVSWSPPASIVSPWPSVLNKVQKQPEIAYDANHNAVVVWTDTDPLLVCYSVLFSGNATWAFPSVIPGQPLGAAVSSRKGISSDRLGNAKVVWNAEILGGWDNQYSIWNGATFSPAAPIFPGGGIGISQGLGIAIAFDPINNATAVHGTALSYNNIWSNREVGDTWQPTNQVTPSGWTFLGWEPRIAHLYNNSVAVTVWTGPGPFDDDIIYRVWIPVLGTWINGGLIDPSGLLGADAPGGCVAIASRSGSPTSPMFIYDVAVTNVLPWKTVVGQGFVLEVNVTVQNQGDIAETFNVTLYANTTSIASQTVILTSKNSQTITFTWNTTGYAKGNYTIKAVVDPVLGEIDTEDNNATDGWVIVAMVGDITGSVGYPDGKVDMLDLWEEARNFGIDYPDIRFKPNFDIDGNLKIDMQDIWLTAREFGKIDP